MELEIPVHLQATARTLRSSLRLRADETAPAVPSDLVESLNLRFSRRLVVIEPPRRASWFARLTRTLSAPGLAAAAACLAIAAVCVPMLRPDTQETFRGSSAHASRNIPVILVSAPADTRQRLSQAGDLEPSAIQTVAEVSAVETFTGAKVIVDFGTSTISAIDDSGRTVHSASIPSDSADLSLSIADAVSRL